MAVIDFVKWDGAPNQLAWKFPSTDLSTWTQLVVNESQDAFVVRGGVYDGPFGAGRHTLSTENLPLLRDLIKLPFGGKSPFSAEVWFVNKITNLDVKWGTQNPIQLLDPRYKIMVSVRAFGQYGIRIADPKRFLLKLVGTVPRFDVDVLAEYFRGAFMTRIKTEIANLILKQEYSVLEVSTQLESLSNDLKSRLQDEAAEYGVALVQFNVHSINVPEDDPAAKTLKAALARKAEMGIVGFTYQQERSFDVMQTAAGNEGTAGAVMGAGMGIGMGIGVAAPLGQMYGQLATEVQGGGKAETPMSAPAPTQVAPGAGQGTGLVTGIDMSERIRLLKELATLKESGILTEEEFIAEKKRILG